MVAIPLIRGSNINSSTFVKFYMSFVSKLSSHVVSYCVQKVRDSPAVKPSKKRGAKNSEDNSTIFCNEKYLSSSNSLLETSRHSIFKNEDVENRCISCQIVHFMSFFLFFLALRECSPFPSAI